MNVYYLKKIKSPKNPNKVVYNSLTILQKDENEN